MGRVYIITLGVEVEDEADLRRVAKSAAARGGLLAADYEGMRSEDGADPVKVDLQMVFDPGHSPDGTDILECRVEEA